MIVRQARRDPAAHPPWITRTLIAACCAVFLLGPASGLDPAYGTGGALTAARTAYFERWGVVPDQLWHSAPAALLSPLTALFVHGNWLHLLGNMLFLHVFGAMAEERLGRLPFALCYLVSGYLALLGFAAAHPDSGQSLVGASGAVSGVLGAFLHLFPRARVTSLFPFLFFLPLRFPAWAVLLFWFALQWPGAGAPGDRPGVAYLAHVLGFGLGFCFAWVSGRRAVRVKDDAAATEGDGTT
ncbi:rhomboid family intramembrane serine protease [Streptomyces caatingaensis]|uniref:Membrane protein n=1 Tax=Streptomyces caatingaensis TaxID=1678637 RepID=A0A0K9XH82_9ACTN|nr:rhomboid family intramembrane serine protease [Streptomyces caatingaensis]KNB52740.1 membrane protein [Streptomyces caatingaensis]